MILFRAKDPKPSKAVGKEEVLLEDALSPSDQDKAAKKVIAMGKFLFLFLVAVFVFSQR